LPRELLVKTGPVDYADWNYRPVLGWIQRQRFALARSLIGDRRFGRLLEIGYASGVFMPELERYCGELYGVDVHDRHAAVAQRLREVGVEAKLSSGSAERIPHPDGMFDAIVCISTLEYVEDIPGATREMCRVLRPGGYLFVVTPGYSPVLDFGLRLLTGESAKANYGDRRERLIPTLAEIFVIEEQRHRPRLTGGLLRMYAGLRLRAPAHGGKDVTVDEAKT
jgi:SAM-dependent methyltransferase